MRQIVTLFITTALFFVSACQKDDSSAQPATPAPAPTALGTPAPLQPPNGSSGLWPPIVFSWNTAANASRYELRAWYISTSGGSSTLFYQATSNTSYTYSSNLGTSFHGRTIYWYVRGANAQMSEFGPWSDVKSFQLQ